MVASGRKQKLTCEADAEDANYRGFDNRRDWSSVAVA